MDWEFVANLQDRLTLLYKSDAVSEMGERHSFLNLQELKYRKNPEIQATLSDLGAAIKVVNHKPMLDRSKLTREDIQALVRKLKEEVQKEQETRNQRRQLRTLIESLQNYAFVQKVAEAEGTPSGEAQQVESKEENKEQIITPGGGDDSPVELLKDMFMHLIQDEKHKFFQVEDWF
jgi:hypothetical protein